MKKTLVEQVMTTPVVTAAQAMPFRDLVALLHARDIGAVPVVATAGQVLGVVSRADLTAKAAGPPATGPPLRPGSRRERRRALARTASELMTAPAVTIAPDATVTDSCPARYCWVIPVATPRACASEPAGQAMRTPGSIEPDSPGCARGRGAATMSLAAGNSATCLQRDAANAGRTSRPAAIVTRPAGRFPGPGKRPSCSRAPMPLPTTSLALLRAHSRRKSATRQSPT